VFDSDFWKRVLNRVMRP